MKTKWMWMLVVAVAIAFAAPAAMAQDEEAKAEEAAQGPNVDKVLEELAAIGPEALLKRVDEMKAQVKATEEEAAKLRSQADAKAKEAEALKQRIQTIEKFTADLNKAMNPEPPKEEQKAAEEKPAEEKKAEEG